MAEFNMLPLYTDTFISDTIDLDATESGAYLMLLMCAWRSPGCRLPDDDVRLARFARCDGRTWRRIRETVMAFWEREGDGFWVNPKLSKVRESCNTSRENKKRGAEAARAAKSLKTNTAPIAEQHAGAIDINLHTVSVSVKEKIEPLPSSPTTSHGVAGRGDLDELEAWLLAMVGEGQPCRANPDISPIVGLVNAGYSRSEIALGIRTALSKGVRARGWGAFVSWITGVRERADRAQEAGEAAPPPRLVPTQATDDDWRKRVSNWQKSMRSVWAMDWGPRPDMRSTRVPPHILAEFNVLQTPIEEVA